MSDFRFRWPAIIASLLIIIGIGWYFFGYPKPKLSPSGYDHALALFSACNRQDAIKIQQIEQLIKDNLVAGTLQINDANWLRKIIGQADRGDWELASTRLRRLLNQQVEPAKVKPLVH